MTHPATETTMIDANRLARIAGVTEPRFRQLAGFPEATIEQRLKDAETEILDPLGDFLDRLARWDRLAEEDLS